MVAERSVRQKKDMVTCFADIRIENVDMSSDKLCKKHSRQKSKVFGGRLILPEELKLIQTKTAPKKKAKAVFDGVIIVFIFIK